MKLDPSTRRYLTCESLDPTTKLPTASICDIAGKPLGASHLGLPVFDEVGTGKAFVRIVAVMPSNDDRDSKALRESYEALKPVHVDGDDSTMRGWYVPAPDFSLKPETATAE